MDELIVLIVKAIYNALRDKSQDTPAQRAAQVKQMQAIRDQMRGGPPRVNRPQMMATRSGGESDILVARMPALAPLARSGGVATTASDRIMPRQTGRPIPLQSDRPPARPTARLTKQSKKPAAPPPLPKFDTAAAKAPTTARATAPTLLTVATGRSRGSMSQLTAIDVIALLSPASIRAQIILNEVLQPPLSLR